MPRTRSTSLSDRVPVAFEDAISLANALDGATDVPGALRVHEESRRAKAGPLEAKADRSMRWFENLERHTDLCPAEFEAALMHRAVSDGQQT